MTTTTASIRHVPITPFTSFNKDVPQEVIRVLLDHQSTEMTAHYARLTDRTVRRIRVHRVNSARSLASIDTATVNDIHHAIVR